NAGHGKTAWDTRRFPLPLLLFSLLSPNSWAPAYAGETEWGGASPAQPPERGQPRRDQRQELSRRIRCQMKGGRYRAGVRIEVIPVQLGFSVDDHEVKAGAVRQAATIMGGVPGDTEAAAVGGIGQESVDFRRG